MTSVAKESKGSILIVDDLPDNLRLLRDALQGESYKVRSCTTGAMALRGAKAANPDVILLDIKLPDYDGYEVCRQLKADEKTAHIPVIFLSALTNTLDKVQGFAVGGADYITKPFQIEEVLARVETHLSIQRLQQSLQEKNLRLQQEIAEHQRTQAALFYEKELAQFTLKSIGDAVITTDAQGYVNSLNPVAESLTGWHRNEAQGLHLFDVFKIIHAITKEPVENPIIQALEQVKIVNLPPNTILISRNGQEFPIDDSVSPIQDSEGNVIGAAIVFRDITDYKRQEEAKLNNILNRAIAAITSYRIFADNTCICDYWSSGCEILFGYTAEELITDPNLWNNNVHPEDLDSMFGQITEGDRLKTMSHVEYRFRHKDGTWHWISASLFSEWDETHNCWFITGVLTDITPRKQAEIALQKTQESLMIAIEAAQMGTWYLDLINDVSSVRSLRHDQIFGYDTPQIEWGEAIARRHILAADRKIWDDAFARAMKTGKLDFEVRVQWPDGSIHWMAAYGRFYFDENGKPLYAGGVNLDITERKQAEIALKERMARERLVTNIAQNIRETLEVNEVLQRTVDQVREFLQADRVVIFRFDPDGDGTVINESLTDGWTSMLSQAFRDDCCTEHYFNFSQADFYARTDISQLEPCYYEFFEPFKVKASLTVPITQAKQLWGYLIVHQCLAPRQWQPTEIELLQQLGIQVSIAIQQSELYEKTKQELLERQKAERKIAEQAVLINIATDAIFVQDLSDQILFWNQGAERLYGWTTAEATGEKTKSLFNQDNELNEALQITIEQGSWQGEITQITKSGKKIIVASRWTLVKNESAQPKSILIVNSDMTDKKQLEKQFYHIQRLESIGTLASGIAHDFNNILTPILGISQLLPLRLTNVDDKTQELLSTLTTSTRRAVNLVKQILLFSRTSDGKFVTLQLSYLFRELIGIAKQTFPKSIEISDQSPSRELWTISADRTQMDQVFMNLMINARDAMPEGGTLAISAENRYLDEHYALLNLEAKPGPYLVVTVSDTGSGIPPELVERIFDPFFTTKEVGKGTGLGLSTVMGIVKNHGGFVRVTSQLGKGTQFEVFLPAIQGEIIMPTLEEEMPNGNGGLILIVEDESSIQEIMKTALEKYNYRTMLANDGIEAIALYAKNQPEISVVLMDMMMPNLDGVTTIRTLKKMNPEVKIIATSGLLDNKQLALQADAQTFLLKPYTISQLLQLLKEMNCLNFT
jgi:two-component system, cell cycle sensor histidine kinase and response regulator CckA